MRCSLLAVYILLSITTPATAASVLVRPDGQGDYPTIQAAIDAVAPGDTVLLADGTYRGSGNRDIEYRGKAITVSSQSGDPGTCILDCQGAANDPHRGFLFRGGETEASLLAGVTITNGYATNGQGGGISCPLGDSCTIAAPTIRGCVITRCSGNGVFVGEYWEDELCTVRESGPLLSRCTVSENVGDGAAYYFDAWWSDLHIDNSRFCDNTGDGLSVYGISQSSIVIEHCDFIGNDSRGVHLLVLTGTTQLVNCCVSDNGQHGAYYDSWDAHSVTMKECSFANNGANGIAVGTGDVIWLHMRNCDVLGNEGHGISAAQGRFCPMLRLDGSRVFGNSGTGIHASAADIDSSVITANGGNGVSIYNAPECARNSVVSQSTISQNGGACISTEVAYGTLAIDRSLLVYNDSVGVDCRGIVPTIANSDVYGNRYGDWIDCLAGMQGQNGNMSTDPKFCVGTPRRWFLRADSPCAAENNGGVQIGGLGVGCGVVGVPDAALPTELLLCPGSPNPFNPRTSISFSLPRAGRTVLAIYDARGALVATLVDAELPAGEQSVTWSGKNSHGAPMPSGIYLGRLEHEGEVRTVRMSLVK